MTGRKEASHEASHETAMGLKEDYARIRDQIQMPEPVLPSVAMFCESELIADVSSSVRAMDVMDAYTAWCEARGIVPKASVSVIGKHLTRIGIQRRKDIVNGGVVTHYLGIRLRVEGEGSS